MLMELYKLCRKYIHSILQIAKSLLAIYDHHSLHLFLFLASSLAVSDPSASTPPRMLTTAGSTTSSSVELNWLPPLHPNGAIRSEIEYEPAVTPGDPVNAGNSSSSLYFTLTLPNEFLTYTVRVVAVNSKG